MSVAQNNQGAHGFVIPSLDGMRAVAVGLVVLTHGGFAFASGTVGVNIFFFLSGFLITTLLRKEAAKGNGISFKKFYIRRCLRILPPMYIVLTVALILNVIGILHGPVVPTAVVLQYAHLSNYVQIFGGTQLPVLDGTEVYWSLCVEEHFYLIFPLAFALILKLKSTKAQAGVLLGICAVVLLWRIGVVRSSTEFDNLWANRGSDTRLDSILFGCFMAMFVNPYFEEGRAQKLNNGWLAGAAVVVLLASQMYKGQWYWHTFRYDLQCLCFFPIFTYVMMQKNSIAFKVLNSKVMTWVGRISYGVYLVHYVVVTVLKQGMTFPPGMKGALMLTVLTFAITLPICSLMFRFIEKPAADMRKRFAA